MNPHTLTLLTSVYLAVVSSFAAAAPPEGETVLTSGGQSDAWTNRRYQPAHLWAYRPLRRPILPGRAKHPVDSFIQSRWPRRLSPAPPATRRTLIRRLSFD
ncbi:MAG: hypothetical protein VX311_04070, partial [Planctomycetota bacterium]|nr:hypothetical protein [Planctomycetota bacterium]